MALRLEHSRFRLSTLRSESRGIAATCLTPTAAGSGRLSGGGVIAASAWPMDGASDFGSEGGGFESHRPSQGDQQPLQQLKEQFLAL